MAKAVKLPSGNYRVQVYAGYKKDENGEYLLSEKTGKKIPDYVSFTHPSKTEAEFLAAEFKRLRKENANPSAFTVKRAMEKYIENRKHILSPSTIQGYEKIIKNNFQGIMDIKIKKLTQDDIQRAVNLESAKVTRRGKKTSAKTIANAHGFLSSVLGVYRPMMKLNTSLPEGKKHVKELPLPQKIFDAVHGTEIELPVLLAMWLSFSMSEIRGIMKSDIKNRVLTLNRVIVDVDNVSVIKEDMKEYERTRKHIVPPYIMNLIDKCKEEYIVPFDSYQITYRWKRALEIHSIPHITFHDLRHVNASVMHLLHVPDKYAMERGGWKTDKTMKSVYQNIFSDERIKIDNKIDRYFENITQNKN